MANKMANKLGWNRVKQSGHKVVDSPVKSGKIPPKSLLTLSDSDPYVKFHIMLSSVSALVRPGTVIKHSGFSEPMRIHCH